MLYVCVRGVMCSCMGSISVFIMQMLYVCVLYASCGSSQFCMTCRLLMLVEDGRGILQSQSHDCLICRHECLFLFTPSCFCECFCHL